MAFAKAEIVHRAEDPPPRIVCSLGAVEIVWNPYIFPLCVVIHFTRGCYVCHMLASLGAYVGQPYNFTYRCPLAGAKISKLFYERKLLTMRILWTKARIEQQEV